VAAAVDAGAVDAVAVDAAAVEYADSGAPMATATASRMKRRDAIRVRS
jgi:hypothetical protein